MKKEGKVIASVADVLLVQWRHCYYESSCTHTHTWNDGQNDQSLNLFQCSLHSPWRR